MYFNIKIYLSTYLYIYLAIYLSINLSIINLSVYVSIYLWDICGFMAWLLPKIWIMGLRGLNAAEPRAHHGLESLRVFLIPSIFFGVGLVWNLRFVKP